MGSYKYLDEILNNKLSNVHTAYLAKVLSTHDNTAKIQPLGLVQNADGTTSKQSVLTQVPICTNVKHYVTSGSSGSEPSNIQVQPLAAGDIVVCICCERDISQAKRGKNVLPPKGRFSQSDSIIIGVL